MSRTRKRLKREKRQERETERDFERRLASGKPYVVVTVGPKPKVGRQQVSSAGSEGTPRPKPQWPDISKPDTRGG